MNTKIPRIIKRADYRMKALMLELERNENEMAAEMFEKDGHPWDEDDREIFFKLEMHSGYQLQAYHKDDGSMADCSYHQLVCKCPECGYPMAVSGADVEVCGNCYEVFEASGGY